jgi:hypothetical protein
LEETPWDCVELERGLVAQAELHGKVFFIVFKLELLAVEADDFAMAMAKEEMGGEH